jgi:hypothetical protein
VPSSPLTKYNVAGSHGSAQHDGASTFKWTMRNCLRPSEASYVLKRCPHKKTLSTVSRWTQRTVVQLKSFKDPVKATWMARQPPQPRSQGVCPDWRKLLDVMTVFEDLNAFGQEWQPIGDPSFGGPGRQWRKSAALLRFRRPPPVVIVGRTARAGCRTAPTCTQQEACIQDVMSTGDLKWPMPSTCKAVPG